MQYRIVENKNIKQGLEEEISTALEPAVDFQKFVQYQSYLKDQQLDVTWSNLKYASCFAVDSWSGFQSIQIVFQKQKNI